MTIVDLTLVMVICPDEISSDLFVEPVINEIRLLGQKKMGSPVLSLREEIFENLQKPWGALSENASNHPYFVHSEIQKALGLVVREEPEIRGESKPHTGHSVSPPGS